MWKYKIKKKKKEWKFKIRKKKIIKSQTKSKKKKINKEGKRKELINSQTRENKNYCKTSKDFCLKTVINLILILITNFFGI